MGVKNDNLTGFREALRGKPSGFKDDFSMKRNNLISNFQKQFPEAWLFCRHRGKFYLESQLYTRSEANKFVSLPEGNEILVGQIFLFIDKESVILCAVQVYNILDKFALDLSSTGFHGQDNKLKPLGYRVEKSTEVRVFKCCSINNKLILFPFLNNLYFINVLTHFEHDT